MALLYSHPLDTSFSGVGGLQAAGIADTGNNRPNGIGTSLVISGGAMVSTLLETDPPTNSGSRAEIVPTVADALGDERWYTWEMRVNDWPLNDACSGDKFFTLMQIHDKDGGPVRAPCFGLAYDGIGIVCFVPNSSPPTETTLSRAPGSAPMSQGVWHKCALRAIWSNAGAGTMEFYLDRRPVFKEIINGTAYNADAPYLKLGVYNGPHLTGYTKRQAMYRNVRTFSSGDSLYDVLGGPPLCAVGGSK